MSGLFGLIGGGVVVRSRGRSDDSGGDGAGRREDDALAGRMQRRRVPRSTGLFALPFERLGTGPRPEHMALTVTSSGDLDLDLQSDDFADLSDLIVNHLHDLHMEDDPPPQPVSARYLASLPRVHGHEYWGEQCPICLEEFGKRETLLQLLCGHTFHESCVKVWLTEKRSCPTCRDELPAADESELREIEILERAQDDERCARECAAAAAALGPGSPCAIFDVLSQNTAAIESENRRLSRADSRQQRRVYDNNRRHQGAAAVQILQMIAEQIERQELEYQARLRYEMTMQEQEQQLQLERIQEDAEIDYGALGPLPTAFLERGSWEYVTNQDLVDFFREIGVEDSSLRSRAQMLSLAVAMASAVEESRGMMDPPV